MNIIKQQVEIQKKIETHKKNNFLKMNCLLYTLFLEKKEEEANDILSEILKVFQEDKDDYLFIYGKEKIRILESMILSIKNSRDRITINNALNYMYSLREYSKKVLENNCIRKEK